MLVLELIKLRARLAWNLQKNVVGKTEFRCIIWSTKQWVFIKLHEKK